MGDREHRPVVRAVIEHPDLELVGLYVHSADKAGRDAGELCGLGTTGVVATNSIDDIVALGADCVLYMRRVATSTTVPAPRVGRQRRDDTQRVPPSASMDPEVRSGSRPRARGGTSIYSTGSSPGFITEALPSC